MKLVKAVNSGDKKEGEKEKAAMAKVRLIIEDDDGNVINEGEVREYKLNIGKGRLADIEGAVEEFKKRALADIEEDLLVMEQAKFVREKKKEES